MLLVSSLHPVSRNERTNYNFVNKLLYLSKEIGNKVRIENVQ